MVPWMEGGQEDGLKVVSGPDDLERISMPDELEGILGRTRWKTSPGRTLVWQVSTGWMLSRRGSSGWMLVWF